MKYVKLARSLRTYGVSFFLVKVRHDEITVYVLEKMYTWCGGVGTEVTEGLQGRVHSILSMLSGPTRGKSQRKHAHI